MAKVQKKGAATRTRRRERKNIEIKQRVVLTNYKDARKKINY